MPLVHQDGFCTAVRIFLEVNGQVLRVSQVGDDSLILRDNYLLESAANATVVISVDDERRTYPIRLREGIRARTVFFDDLPSTQGVQ